MEKEVLIVGIDPGASGGISFISSSQARAIKMPETETSVAEAFEICQTCKCIAYIEAVHSMPKQGVKSTFSFGKQYGTLLGVLAALKIERNHVTPFTWQNNLRCLSKGDKNVTKRRAQELFPELKITHATADALLIGRFGFNHRLPL